MSRFQNYCTAKTKDTYVATITRLLKGNEHETNTSTAWPSSHGHPSTQQQQQHPPSGTATLDSSSTRTPVVVAVANSSGTVCGAVVSVAAKSETHTDLCDRFTQLAKLSIDRSSADRLNSQLTYSSCFLF